jgi:hypothetical protein
MTAINVDRELTPNEALERSQKELADIKFALDELRQRQVLRDLQILA